MTVDPVEVVRRARTAELVDPDGGEVVLDIAPGLAADEIDQLRAELGIPLPRELTALLYETRGINGIEPLDFTGRTMDVELADVSPLGLRIAADGFGNFWVLDLTPVEVDVAPVFFACHDPPVLLYQGHSLGHFLDELLRMYEPPHASLVDDVRADRLFNVWGTNPGTFDHPHALAGDDDLREFAAEVDDSFLFVDLRSPEIGMGFSWGRYGPRTDVRRHGYERLFAYARPEKKPGLFRRLSGRAR
jgi:hypothetical protein